ncbi:MAG: 3-dehydroquinate synthase [Actinomycetaceae bacterium]|nr:3-dehydroquinate synthase [Actinomycetaceae bacterium]
MPTSPIFLTGLPGSGKTTVGRLLAKSLACPFIDTDEKIVETFGSPIPAIFKTISEGGFRLLESHIVESCLTQPAVVALGGGAASFAKTRQILQGQTVIYLDVPVDEAVKRVGDGRGRPLLSGNPEQAIRHLHEQREGAYRSLASMSVDASKPADIVASRILELVNLESSVTQVPVFGAKNYQVTIGRSLASRLNSVIPHAATKALVIHPEALARQAQDLAGTIDIEAHTFEVPDGEACKTAEVLESCWDACAKNRLGRQDVIVSLGGGAVTDLAGFTAASWLRGIEVVHVPTTLLAMVDAAIGGKTGIDSQWGKNLIGAFHPPHAVLCDMEYLQTLPRAEMIAGLGEIIKAGYIADPKILDIARTSPHTLLDPTSPQLKDVVSRAVQVKARVVSEDLYESGIREILNYGHTFGHAIEKCEGFQIRHGQAVAIGMVYAAHLQRILTSGRVDMVEDIMSLLASLGLPTSYAGDSWANLLDAMYSDKKIRGSQLRFVLLDAVAQPKVVSVNDVDALAQAAFSVGVSR